MKKKLIPAAIIFILISSTVSAVDFESMRVGFSKYMIFSQTSENAPYVFASGLSVGMTIAITDKIAFEPAIDLFTAFYGFNADDRTLPVDESERYIYMAQLILDPAFVYRIRFSPILELKIMAAPSLILSFPLRAWDNGEERYPETFSYLYGMLRFVEPMIGAALVYKVTDTMALDVRTKIYIPWFHIWDGEGLQFQDQMRINLSLGFQFDI